MSLPAPYSCWNCHEVGCETCSARVDGMLSRSERAEDIAWLAEQHGVSPAWISELLGDDPMSEICIGCLTWLRHGETTVCSWCRD